MYLTFILYNAVLCLNKNDFVRFIFVRHAFHYYLNVVDKLVPCVM